MTRLGKKIEAIETRGWKKIGRWRREEDEDEDEDENIIWRNSRHPC